MHWRNHCPVNHWKGVVASHSSQDRGPQGTEGAGQTLAGCSIVKGRAKIQSKPNSQRSVKKAAQEWCVQAGEVWDWAERQGAWMDCRRRGKKKNGEKHCHLKGLRVLGLYCLSTNKYCWTVHNLDFLNFLLSWVMQKFYMSFFLFFLAFIK